MLFSAVAIPAILAQRQKPIGGFNKAVNSYSVRPISLTHGEGIMMTIDATSADRCSESLYVPGSTMQAVNEAATASSLYPCTVSSSEDLDDLVAKYTISSVLQCSAGKEHILFCSFGFQSRLFSQRRMQAVPCISSSCALNRVPCNSSRTVLNRECASSFVSFKAFMEINKLYKTSTMASTFDPNPVVTTKAPVVTTSAPVVTTTAPVVTTTAPVVEAEPVVDTSSSTDESGSDRRLGDIGGVNMAGFKFAVNDVPDTAVTFFSNPGNPCVETLYFPGVSANTLYVATQASKAVKCYPSVTNVDVIDASWYLTPVVDCSDPETITITCAATINDVNIKGSREDTIAARHSNSQNLSDRISCDSIGTGELMECASIIQNHISISEYLP